jgi:hypothetical protein
VQSPKFLDEERGRDCAIQRGLHRVAGLEVAGGKTAAKGVACAGQVVYVGRIG